jgi:hypothetical protein
MRRQNLGDVATIQFRILCLPISYLKLKMKTYEAIILHVDLCVRETCSFTIRKEHILGVFEENIWTLQRGYGRRMEKSVQCEFHYFTLPYNVWMASKGR